MRFTLYILLLGLMVAAPLGVHASVGVTPAAHHAELIRNDKEDLTLTFMRDKEDTQTEMMIYVYSDQGFLVTEGRSYYMGPGDEVLKIPYRIASKGYEPGEYKGRLYVQPDRIDEYAVEGNPVKVQAGVKMEMVVRDEYPKEPRWYTTFYNNLKQNTMVARDNMLALARGIF